MRAVPMAMAPKLKLPKPEMRRLNIPVNVIVNHQGGGAGLAPSQLLALPSGSSSNSQLPLPDLREQIAPTAKNALLYSDTPDAVKPSTVVEAMKCVRRESATLDPESAGRALSHVEKPVLEQPKEQGENVAPSALRAAPRVWMTPSPKCGLF